MRLYLHANGDKDVPFAVTTNGIDRLAVHRTSRSFTDIVRELGVSQCRNVVARHVLKPMKLLIL